MAFQQLGPPRYFATQPEQLAATGRMLGTSRIISAAVHDATGVQVQVVGKPSRHALLDLYLG